MVSEMALPANSSILGRPGVEALHCDSTGPFLYKRPEHVLWPPLYTHTQNFRFGKLFFGTLWFVAFKADALEAPPRERSLFLEIIFSFLGKTASGR